MRKFQLVLIEIIIFKLDDNCIGDRLRDLESNPFDFSILQSQDEFVRNEINDGGLINFPKFKSKLPSKVSDLPSTSVVRTEFLIVDIFSSKDDLVDAVHKVSCHVIGFCEVFFLQTRILMLFFRDIHLLLKTT